MTKISPLRPLARAVTLCGTGLVTIRAEAGGTPGPEDLFALPIAVLQGMQMLVIYVITPTLVLLVLAHRPIIAMARRLQPRLQARLDALRERLHRRARKVLPPVPFSESDELAAATKMRMTEIHGRLRRLAPEMLPAFAEYRAAQNRLLAETARNPGALVSTRFIVLNGLAQIEAATEKLSVVLVDATKEYALGNYADTLEKLTGAAMECLCGLRARARLGAGSGVSLAGGTGML